MRDALNDRGELGGRNLLVAGSAGAIVFLTILFFGVPGLDPAMWDEVAVSAGLRPPQAIFPGLWRGMTFWMFSPFGVDGAIGILNVLGAAIGGACAAVLCLIIRLVLSLLVRTAVPRAAWSDRIAPFFAFVAALLFGFSDPLCRIARTFSPDELRLAMFLAIIFISLRWFTVGGRWRVFLSMTLMGVLAAETPIAFVLPILFVGFYVVVWHCIVDEIFRRPDAYADPIDLPKWRMLFLFIGGVGLGAWINVQTFASLGGIRANGWNVGTIYFIYGASYWHVISGSASLIGWVLGLGFCVIPLMAAVRLFPRLSHDDWPMPFTAGSLMLFVGFVALLQIDAFRLTRFWMFSREIVQVRSGFLLVFFVACAITALALAGAAFAFECQRFYLDEGDPLPPRMKTALRLVVPVLSLLLLAWSARDVRKPVESEMQRIVDDVVSETVRECGDAKWLFTDGRLDAGLELEAARRGSPLRPLNMMSGASAWEVSLRTRGFEDGTEDRKAAETGIPSLLRMWAGEKVGGMDEAALQLGFEFWKRERKALPEASGLVARTKWADRAVVTNGILRANGLASRILALAPRLDVADPTPALASAFSAASWRLSRFARMRSDVKIANALDECNSALRRMMSAIEYERMRMFMQLTPREGLELALKRANFAEAQRYAASVARNDPDDPQANFAIGMGAIMDGRFKDAEFYLARCLKRRPLDPAVLNNLSIVCRKQRKYVESEDYARRALKIAPDSPEVKTTLDDALRKAP